MASPTAEDEIQLKRILRYLSIRSQFSTMFPWQSQPRSIEIHTDSDWAGCLRTRRSTSGGTLRYGRHLLHPWSKTQAVVSLSSAEAELNSMVKGLAEGLLVRNTIGEFHEHVQLRLFCDSSAARGIAARRGAGRTKHLEVKQIWLQEQVQRGILSVFRVPRSLNPADMLTHHWVAEDGRRHLEHLLCRAGTS